MNEMSTADSLMFSAHSGVAANDVPEESLDELEKMELKLRASQNLQVPMLTLSKINRILNEIPSNVNRIDSSLARYLANRVLEGAGAAQELMALAERYELNKETLKKAEESKARLLRAPQLGYKTAADKTSYVHLDEDYLRAQQEAIEAKVFRKAVENKNDLLIKYHYSLKKQADLELDKFPNPEGVPVGEPSNSKDAWEDLLAEQTE